VSYPAHSLTAPSHRIRTGGRRRREKANKTHTSTFAAEPAVTPRIGAYTTADVHYTDDMELRMQRWKPRTSRL